MYKIVHWLDLLIDDTQNVIHGIYILESDHVIHREILQVPQQPPRHQERISSCVLEIRRVDERVGHLHTIASCIDERALVEEAVPIVADQEDDIQRFRTLRYLTDELKEFILVGV